MKLNFRKIGETGEPLIILHGLYGSSDNWLNIGQQLSGNHIVYLLDQRNHGHSPHSNTHTYEEMRDDLKEFMDDQKIGKAIILGHSMGGKTAIYFSMEYPEKVSRLIVVDISPTSYHHVKEEEHHYQIHEKILTALSSLNTEEIKTLKEADNHLAQYISYKGVRQFLLKNLKRDSNKKFYWILNIDTLQQELENIMNGVQVDDNTIQVESFPILFIKGEQSDYISEEDKIKIKKLFPKAVITSIKGAGHWVHAEKRNEFLSVVEKFIES